MAKVATAEIILHKFASELMNWIACFFISALGRQIMLHYFCLLCRQLSLQLFPLHTCKTVSSHILISGYIVWNLMVLC